MSLFRILGYLIAALLAITVLRSVIGVLLKGVSDLFRATSPTGPLRPTAEGMGGELKKDPVCGTFISAASAFQKASGGTTHYFCSTECRDKFKG